MIVAPDYDADALELLQTKKKNHLSAADTADKADLIAIFEEDCRNDNQVARTTTRLEGGVNSVVKNVLRNHRGLSEESRNRSYWQRPHRTA